MCLSDAELEALRKKRLLELQRKLLEEQRRAEIEKQIEMRKRIALRRILTPEARSRLNRLRMVRPELVAQLEEQLIQLAQTGRLPIPLSDDQLKRILGQIASRRREIRIRRV
jgi:programmed cell death protein 5